MRIPSAYLRCFVSAIVFVLLGAMLTACPPGGEGEGEGETETITLRGGVSLVMRWIPAGTFMMGRNPGEAGSSPVEDPRHSVALSSGFWLGIYEVTKAQWEAVMRSEPWSGKLDVLDDADSPAVYISWNDAQDFITALNSQTGLSFRLPTEAEWEYACRAGTTTRFFWGDDPSLTAISSCAWWKSNAADASAAYAHVAGQRQPNAWGLYDMSGNAVEWCEDRYGPYSAGSVTDPTGPLAGTSRILRGGSFYTDSFTCRSANRGQGDPAASENASFGFRIVRNP